MLPNARESPSVGDSREGQTQALWEPRWEGQTGEELGSPESGPLCPRSLFTTMCLESGGRPYTPSPALRFCNWDRERRAKGWGGGPRWWSTPPELAFGKIAASVSHQVAEDEQTAVGMGEEAAPILVAVHLIAHHWQMAACPLAPAGKEPTHAAPSSRS